MLIPYSDWMENLLLLGINSQLLLSSAIDSAIYPALYLKLKIPMSFIQKSLQINSEWQLQALTGDTAYYPSISALLKDNSGACIAHYAAWSGSIEALTWVKKNYPHLLHRRDKFGLNVAHYSAWSGNKDALSWVKINAPKLLCCYDGSFKNIAHFSAWSGSDEALNWVMENSPQLLVDRDCFKISIAHCAAWSGSSKALEWVKTYYPKLLLAKDIAHKSILYYAAWSGNIRALDWVKRNAPQLLLVKRRVHTGVAHYAAWSGNWMSLAWVAKHLPQSVTIPSEHGLTIAHYAAWSRNTLQFNFALTLTKAPYRFEVPAGLVEKAQVIALLTRALSTNATLTFVTLPKDTPSEVLKKIEVTLCRNMKIQTAIIMIQVLLQGLWQKDCALARLNCDVLFAIFTKMMPKDINNDYILFAFNQAKCKLDPVARINRALEHLCFSIESELSRLNLAVNKPSRDIKKQAIIELQALIKSAITQNTFTGLLCWCDKYGDLINRRPNLITTFFQSRPPTIFQKLRTQINSIVKLNDQHQANAVLGIQTSV